MPGVSEYCPFRLKVPAAMPAERGELTPTCTLCSPRGVLPHASAVLTLTSPLVMSLILTMHNNENERGLLVLRKLYLSTIL